jgi:hypothetical protein
MKWFAQCADPRSDIAGDLGRSGFRQRLCKRAPPSYGGSLLTCVSIREMRVPCRGERVLHTVKAPGGVQQKGRPSRDGPCIRRTAPAPKNRRAGRGKRACRVQSLAGRKRLIENSVRLVAVTFMRVRVLGSRVSAKACGLRYRARAFFAKKRRPSLCFGHLHAISKTHRDRQQAHGHPG